MATIQIYGTLPGGGGEGGSEVEYLVLNTNLDGTLPLDVTITDTDDAAMLNAIKTDVKSDTKLPPLFFKRGASNSDTDAFYSFAVLSEVDLYDDVLTLTYVNPGNGSQDGLYYTITEDNGDWIINMKNKVIYSTSDLTPGTSPLDAGSIYYVYE